MSVYNKKFLKALDLETYKEQRVRITILDFQSECPLVGLEGKCTSGSCNVNGASSMRRTASCSVIVDYNGIIRYGYSDAEQYYDITEINNLISINKKVRFEIGVMNTLRHTVQDYNDKELIWFPLGVYVVKAASVSKNNSGVNISLTLNDKLALLNGDVGGIIPAATLFSENEIFSSSGLSKTTEKLLVKDIIRYVVTEFGGERADNVIINDIPETITKIMKWNGKNSIFLIEDGNNVYLSNTKPAENYTEFIYGQDIGNTSEPFVYPGTLECNAGETVVSVLDKIKNALGNYEYFYNLDGQFVFQEIKNYINNAPSKTLLELEQTDYDMIPNFDITTYEFDQESAKLISSISNAPQYANIKNDFVLWGSVKTSTGAVKPIRYHLALDDKPIPGQQSYFGLVYTDYRGLQAALPLTEDNYQVVIEKTNIEDKNKYYYYNEKIWHWDEDNECFRPYNDCVVGWLKSSDWRTELYYQGLWAEDKSFTAQPYSAELNSEWTKIVNLLGKEDTVTKERDGIMYKVYFDTFLFPDNPTNQCEYWLDFLEGNKFSVAAIGRRTKVVSDQSVNCIFPTEVPNYTYIEADGDTTEERNKAPWQYVQVTPEMYSQMSLGGSQNSAFEAVKEILYNSTHYNESVSLSVTPIYYLEPNTLIRICDKDVSLNGNYLVKSISLPLTYNGTSTISAIKIVEKNY